MNHDLDQEVYYGYQLSNFQNGELAFVYVTLPGSGVLVVGTGTAWPLCVHLWWG